MKDYRELLKSAGLKVTPQRLNVLMSFDMINKHPTTDEIIEGVHKISSDIAVGTIYNILESFVNKKIITRVKTEKDVMRYDPVLDKHHHIYCTETGVVSDYYDEELNEIIDNYFKSKHLDNFAIEDIKLQIVGRYI